MSPPILKWPGGKQWVSDLVIDILSAELRNKYFEPFLGGAAIYLDLKPECAFLSDVNDDLIHFYRAIADDPQQVIRRARQLGKGEAAYYRVRRSVPRTEIGKAARFLYLNKNCWGGIYRKNRKGAFNVPYGFYDRPLCHRESVLASAELIARASLDRCDFAVPFQNAAHGDVVFADPPYTSRGQFNGFVRYNETLFSWADQIRLSKVSRSARRRGAFVMVCGSFHRDVIALYENWWVVQTKRISRVAKRTSSRTEIFECLILSRKPKFAPLGLTKISSSFLRTIPLAAH